MNIENHRILHTSDWHLGAPVDWPNSEFKQGVWINTFRQYRKDAVEQIIGHAIRNSVNAVFVAGDVTDVYGYTALIPDIHDFLRSKVIDPLRDQNIKLVIALGSHDIKSDESAELFLSLKRQFEGTMELLVPEDSEELQVLKQRLGPKKVSPLKGAVTWSGFTLACGNPPTRGKWIQLKHKDNGSIPASTVCPVYRAFGDKHAMTYGKNDCYYPGTPFARSSVSDNKYTDAGPRYCLLCEIGGPVTPIRLDVPEVALLEKSLTQNEWSIFYQRNHMKGTWIKEPAYKESAGGVLDRVLHEKPGVSFVTFVIKAQEETTHSGSVLRQAIDFVKSKQRVIVASREGIITVMLDRSRSQRA